MTVTGTVIKVKGKTVTVKTSRPASCEHCPTASVCNKKETRLNVLNTVGASVGNTVRVRVENDNAALGVLAYMFLTPLLILAIGYIFSLINIWLTVVAVALIAPYYLGLRYFNRVFRTKAYTEEILPDGYTEDACE